MSKLQAAEAGLMIAAAIWTVLFAYTALGIGRALRWVARHL